MILIAGLGNPGTKYQATRHNVGFMVIDYLQNLYNLGEFQNKFKADIAQCLINNQKILLVKPTTYMNLSGHAVQSIISYYKLQADQLIVIHDDLDLELGKIKLKFNGGDAGHNGVKSINSMLGHSNYYRIRIGIGKPENLAVSDYVLQNFHTTELAKVKESIKLVGDNINLVYANKLDEFQSKIKATI